MPDHLHPHAPATASIGGSSRTATAAPGDDVVTASVLDTISAVTQERADKLSRGATPREVNDEYAREYSRYVASVTHQDEATIYEQISVSIARAGNASATLLQLVVGARVYQSLGMRPSVGVFGATACNAATTGATA